MLAVAAYFLRCQHRRFVGLHRVQGAAHRTSRVHRHRLAHHQLVEQVAQRGQRRLGSRCRVLARLLLDPRGDVKRLHGGDRRHAQVAPSHKLRHTAAGGPPRVPAADVRREEFQKRRAACLPATTINAGRRAIVAIGANWVMASPRASTRSQPRRTHRSGDTHRAPGSGTGMVETQPREVQLRGPARSQLLWGCQ